MSRKDSQRVCPICCSAERGETLHAQQFTLPNNHILSDKYDVVACNQCGFVYADTSSSQAIYDKYYAEMSMYEVSCVSNDNSLYARRAEWINAFFSDNNTSFIDVGCGNGRLLMELQKLNYSNLTALDPSKKCIEVIRNRGINGIVSSVFNVPKTKHYDCVILSGVLEHIYDVSKVMQTVKMLTKPNGLIFVCVPDASRYQYHDAVPFDYFNVEHINHFDEISLINLGFFHGLSAVSFLKTLHAPSTATSSASLRVKQPIIFCMYQNKTNEINNWKSYSKQSVVSYISQTQTKKNAYHIIDEFVRSGDEIIVWGVGNYASRLLATSSLNKCNIVMFVDNDAHKQGTNINGKVICAPNAILTMRHKPIIAIAAVFYDEIILEIKRRGIRNKVVVLR